MPFRFTDPEHLAGETGRIAIEQIDRALRELADDSLDRHETIHQVRKRCKKLRGLLRLVRGSIGGDYKEENAWFRDAARPLSAARDAKVMVDTYDAVMERFGHEVDRPSFAPLRKKLTLRMRGTVEEAKAIDERLAEFHQRLEEARDRVPAWAARVDGMPELLAGMEKTYQRGRKAMETAYAEPSGEHFHEWRKRVKYHWYHCRLLEDCWPPLMKARARETAKLADALGDAHDLSVFRALLEAEPALCSSAEQQQAMLGLIDQHREALRRDAWAPGQRLFASKPGKLRKEFERYAATWKAA